MLIYSATLGVVAVGIAADLSSGLTTVQPARRIDTSVMAMKRAMVFSLIT